jgi:capsular polysaccharide biosynthesis protein
MELRHFLRELLRRSPLMLVAVVVTAVAAYGISVTLPKSYDAEARLVVRAGLGRVGAGTDDVLAAPRVGQTYAVLATTRPVLLDVVEQAKLPYGAAELARRMTVTADLDTPILTITMADPDPNLAAAAANTMAEALVELATDRTTIGSAPVELLSIIETATPPDDASAPRPLFNTVLAAAAVLVALVAGLALALYVRDDRTVPQRAPFG